MGWCSLILVSVVLMNHGTLKPNPLDELTVNLNLNDAPNVGHTFGSHEIESKEWKTGKTSAKDPPSQERGQQTDKKRKRILGSSLYIPHVHNPGIPDWEHWTASLRIKKWEGVPLRHTGFTSCGGVLITNQHILTALHCVIIKQSLLFGTLLNYNDVEIFFDPENVLLWMGMKFTPIRFYYTNMIGRNSTERKAERLGKNKIKDDIVLIKLNKLVTAPLQPIPRSEQDAIYTLTKGGASGVMDVTNNFWFAGWGIFRLPRQPANILRYTDKLKPRKREERRLCPKNPYYEETNICFLSTTINAACEGDSGSPGVVGVYNEGSAKPVWHLQSIQSTAAKCNELNSTQYEKYSVHMDVYKYERDIDRWLALP